MLDPDPATGGTYAVYNAIRPIQFKTRIAGLASAAIQGVAVISEAGGSYQDALTDRAGVVESAMFGVLVDTNGQSLTETERATIRALYSLNGIDARDTTFVQVTTAKDEQVRVVPGVKNKRWEEIKNYKVTERVTEIVDQLPGGGFGEAEFSGNAEFELGVRTRDGSPQIEWKTLVTPITMQAATIVGGVALKPEWIQATTDHEDVHVTKALQVAQSVDAVVRRLDADLQQVPAEARNARAHAVTQFLNTVGPKWFETRLALERIRQRFHFDHLTCQTRGVVGGVYTVHPETYQTVWNLRETQEAFLQVMKDPVLFPNSQVQTVDQGVEFLKTAIGKYDGEILAVMYNEAKAIMHKG